VRSLDVAHYAGKRSGDRRFFGIKAEPLGPCLAAVVVREAAAIKAMAGAQQLAHQRGLLDATIEYVDCV
jgi:hypothetical protein